MSVQPGPAKKPRRTLMIVLLAVLAVLALCVAGAVIIGLTNQTSNPAPTTSFDPADIGAPTPDAPCSTSRLGKSFIRDGVTYTCQGPEPYRWRKS